MNNERKPDRFSHIRTFGLIFSILLGCCALALSGYLFYKVERGSTPPTSTSTGFPVAFSPVSIEHEYMDKSFSNGICQVPKGRIFIFG